MMQGLHDSAARMLEIREPSTCSRLEVEQPPPACQFGQPEILDCTNTPNTSINANKNREGILLIRVSTNGTKVTPRYGGVAKMVYYIYDDTW